ncbi:MAG: B12-binding domain-containing radical SAM protein [Desulfobulbaceae bacterium]|nr:B12-binding domain-containing radical SAM protein [Desulfobulbaceae bacterium]HIJ79503.1 B12-binding domain-containing radical SAM protein [Deltaproteobacteria bacterium]
MKGNGKVLFIVHDVYQEDNQFPLGVAYLASVLREYGADVTVCCQDVYHYSNEELAEKYLVGQEYDLIGIGFLAARFKETVVGLCETVHTHKNKAKIIFGGHGPSSEPEYILQNTKGDLIAIGEAEETIVDVLDSILRGKNFAEIKGIAYKDDCGAVHVNERRKPIMKVDTIPYPAWDLFPMDIYTTNMQYHLQGDDEKAIQILTGRGCVNRCTFCYRMEKGVRFRSIDNVLSEMKMLYDEYGVTYFAIQDEVFIASVDRLREFVEGLSVYGLLNKIKYNINAGIRANIATDELAILLKESGCCYVNVGFESVTQECLDDFKKNTTVTDNFTTAKLMKKHAVPMGINFIWGIMSDTAETLRKSVDFIKQFQSYNELRTIRPITPFPGCELYKYAISKGLLAGPADFFEKFSNSDLLTVNFTNIPDEEFYKLLIEANKELIFDYFEHTNGDMDKAQGMVDNFNNLYFKGEVKFRGARHFESKKYKKAV